MLPVSSTESRTSLGAGRIVGGLAFLAIPVLAIPRISSDLDEGNVRELVLGLTVVGAFVLGGIALLGATRITHVLAFLPFAVCLLHGAGMIIDPDRAIIANLIQPSTYRVDSTGDARAQGAIFTIAGVVGLSVWYRTLRRRFRSG